MPSEHSNKHQPFCNHAASPGCEQICACLFDQARTRIFTLPLKWIFDTVREMFQGSDLVLWLRFNLFTFHNDTWLINHHHMCTTPIKRFLEIKQWWLIALHQQLLKKNSYIEQGGARARAGEGEQHRHPPPCSSRTYFSRSWCSLSSSAGTRRLVPKQPDSFVKTWAECDLFIKRRSVPWHLQHPLKWRCITYFTRRIKSHPSLRLSPSWNVVQLEGY